MTVAATRENKQGHTYLTVWDALSQADGEGSAEQIPGASDRSVQISGDLDTGTVAIEGSNVSAAGPWATMNNSVGDPLTFSATGIHAVNENCLFMRPVLSGAGASADVNVHLLSRSTTR